MPSVAVAGSTTTVIVTNTTAVFSLQSINYGSNFSAPFLEIANYTNWTTSVENIGVVASGANFASVGLFNGTLAATKFVASAWEHNYPSSYWNLTLLFTSNVLSSPALFKYIGVPQAQLFVMAVDGGPLSKLSLYYRNTSSNWAQVPCQGCFSTTYRPGLATDGTAVLVCGVNTTVTACFLSTDSVSAYVPTAYSPSGKLTGELALSGTSLPGHYVAAFINSSNAIFSQVTLTAGATPWSVPLTVFSSTASPAVILALAQDSFLAFASTSTAGVQIAALTYISQTWSAPETTLLSNVAAWSVNADQSGNLALVSVSSSGVLSVLECITASVVSDPPSRAPTPSGAEAVSGMAGMMVVLGAAMAWGGVQ